MVCDRCAALPAELRRHPAPNAIRVATGWRALAELVCVRCGASRHVPDSTDLLLKTLLRLDRVGLGAGTPPLLQAHDAAAATAA
jgi:hypothetical protein